MLATGTIRLNRGGIPATVRQIKDYFEKAMGLERSTGFWLRETSNPSTVYIYWYDSKVVCIVSTAHPGHSTSTVSQFVKTTQSRKEIPVPTAEATWVV